MVGRGVLQRRDKKGTQLFMPNEPSGSGMRFQVICSETAAAALCEAECRDTIRHVIELAQEHDRGVHEGLTFSFDMRGKEWMVVVDLIERWVKILGKDEMDQVMKEETRRN